MKIKEKPKYVCSLTDCDNMHIKNVNHYSLDELLSCLERLEKGYKLHMLVYNEDTNEYDTLGTAEGKK